jgi:predicted Zn finger-like uncharacterized protein
LVQTPEFLIRCAVAASTPVGRGARNLLLEEKDMKITCNSCGAKYTIADEKVVGRRVKVRCKSCKASILVDGTGGEGGGEAGADEEHEEEAGDAVAVAPQAAPASPAGKAPPAKTVKKNTWSVNLSDDDSREMTTDELVQGWKDGTVSQDAYVWKDGMDDWKPILEVPELKLRLKAIAPKAKAEEGVVTSSKRAGAAAAAAPGSDDLLAAWTLLVAVTAARPLVHCSAADLSTTTRRHPRASATRAPFSSRSTHCGRKIRLPRTRQHRPLPQTFLGRGPAPGSAALVVAAWEADSIC